MFGQWRLRRIGMTGGEWHGSLRVRFTEMSAILAPSSPKNGLQQVLNNWHDEHGYLASVSRGAAPYDRNAQY